MDNVQAPGNYDDLPAEIAKAQLAQGPNAAPAAPSPIVSKTDAPAAVPTWEEKVKEAGLTEAQARGILREVMARGFYEREFTALGGEVRFTFRSRDGFTRNRLAEARDTIRSNDVRVHTQVEFRTLLAGSLVAYNGTALKFADPADTAAMYEANAARVAFIDSKIPDPVLNIMMTRLGDFDKWVYAAMWDGAVTAF